VSGHLRLGVRFLPFNGSPLDSISRTISRIGSASCRPSRQPKTIPSWIVARLNHGCMMRQWAWSCEPLLELFALRDQGRRVELPTSRAQRRPVLQMPLKQPIAVIFA